MRTLRERFDAKWKLDERSGCWLWTATRTNPRRGAGYGRISSGARLIVAHRVAWELFRGPIPEGLRVLHACDTPPCVNPEHLFVGTQADNIRDMRAKGRLIPPPPPTPAQVLRGEDVATARLTEACVRAIRASAATHAELARRYGVTQQAIAAVRSRRTWRHVA